MPASHHATPPAIDITESAADMTYASFSKFLDPNIMEWVVNCHTDLGTDYYSDEEEHLQYESRWLRDDPSDETSSRQPRWTRIMSDGTRIDVPPSIADSLEHLTDKWLARTEDAEKELLRNIVITAMEGGSDAWMLRDEYNPDAPGDVLHPIAVVYEMDDEGLRPGECSGWGGHESGMMCQGHRITLETVRKGMELARIISPLNFEGHNFDSAIADNDAGDVDADGADIAVQFGLFGEIVYG